MGLFPFGIDVAPLALRGRKAVDHLLLQAIQSAGLRGQSRIAFQSSLTCEQRWWANLSPSSQS